MRGFEWCKKRTILYSRAVSVTSQHANIAQYFRKVDSL